MREYSSPIVTEDSMPTSITDTPGQWPDREGGLDAMTSSTRAVALP